MVWALRIAEPPAAPNVPALGELSDARYRVRISGKRMVPPGLTPILRFGFLPVGGSRLDTPQSATIRVDLGQLTAVREPPRPVVPRAAYRLRRNTLSRRGVIGLASAGTVFTFSAT